MHYESSAGPTDASAATALSRYVGLLTVTAPAGEAGRSVQVDPRGAVVGRDVGCDLALASDHVSRRHAVIRVRDGGYEVQDLGSKNGTQVNGQSVTGPHRLQDGDRVGFADVQTEFRLAQTARQPRRSQPPADVGWQPDRRTEATDLVQDRWGRPPRTLRHDLHEAPGLSVRGLLLAVAGSVVGVVLTGAASTGPWGTLAGAAVLPVVSAAFSTKRAGEKGRVRTAAVLLLSLSALAITWAGVSLADLAAGRSVVPGNNGQARTFPGPAAEHSDSPPDPTPTGSGTGTASPTVEVSPVDCGTVAVGSSADCAPTVITYNGRGRLHITRVEVTGAHPDDFTAGQQCVGTWLDPGQTCQLTITFHPAAADQRSATLVVHQNLPAPDTGTPTSLTGTGGPAANADTCLDGYVWREAVADDHVCVTPETRAQAGQDNDLAESRRNPAGGPYGPDTCLDGYVWRGAVPDDHVCVTPETRAQTEADNAAADSRRAG